jgi:hypothetical protein
MQISAHETDHVTFLIAGLGGAGSANFVAKPTFDFTVNGAFDPFNKTENYGGVRAISCISTSF